KRRFDANYLEDLGIGQPDTRVSFSTLCGGVVTDNDLDTSLTCDQESNITLGPGEVPEVFDIAAVLADDDDSQFTLTITEYVNDGGCGAPPYQVEFLLTKI